jgi:hypothetical protein
MIKELPLIIPKPIIVMWKSDSSRDNSDEMCNLSFFMKAFIDFSCGGEFLLADVFDRSAAPGNEIEHQGQGKENNDCSDQKVFGHRDSL